MGPLKLLRKYVGLTGFAGWCLGAGSGYLGAFLYYLGQDLIYQRIPLLLEGKYYAAIPAITKIAETAGRVTLPVGLMGTTLAVIAKNYVDRKIEGLKRFIKKILW